MVGSVGLAAGGSASPLLAASMTHGDALLGLPLGVLVLGSAVGALSISWRSTTAGRAASLSAGTRFSPRASMHTEPVNSLLAYRVFTRLSASRPYPTREA